MKWHAAAAAKCWPLFPFWPPFVFVYHSDIIKVFHRLNVTGWLEEQKQRRRRRPCRRPCRRLYRRRHSHPCRRCHWPSRWSHRCWRRWRRYRSCRSCFSISFRTANKTGINQSNQTRPTHPTQSKAGNKSQLRMKSLELIDTDFKGAETGKRRDGETKSRGVRESGSRGAGETYSGYVMEGGTRNTPRWIFLCLVKKSQKLDCCHRARSLRNWTNTNEFVSISVLIRVCLISITTRTLSNTWYHFYSLQRSKTTRLSFSAFFNIKPPE